MRTSIIRYNLNTLCCKYTNTNLKHGSYRHFFFIDYDPKHVTRTPTSWAFGEEGVQVRSTLFVVTLVFMRDVLDTVSGLSVELFA